MNKRSWILIAAVVLAGGILKYRASNAQTYYDKFIEQAKVGGFEVVTISKYGTFNPLEFFNPEPLITAEARKKIASSSGYDTWKSIVYINNGNDPLHFSGGYYMVSCARRELKSANQEDYQDMRKLNGYYDALGHASPENFRPDFSQGEILTVMSTFPTIDLNQGVILTSGGSKPLDYWQREIYQSDFDRYCPKK